jgi:hypothetical protein
MPEHPVTLAEAVARFGEQVTAKFRTAAGEPEEHLRAPFEELVGWIAKHQGLADVVFAGEEHLSDLRVRPDYAVVVSGALIGHVEVKAPGKGADPARYRDLHDKRQWHRLQSLPNLLYTDGHEWALYRDGERFGDLLRIEGDVTTDGSSITVNDDRLARLLSAFLTWDPIPPRSPLQLAVTAARLCRLLRAEALELLATEHSLRDLARDWRDLLFPDADDDAFADQYAQTVTFALLLARVDDIPLREADLARVAERLRARHSLMGTALRILTDQQLLRRLATSIRTLVRVLAVVDWDLVTRGDTDSWLLFYEAFLAEYDPKLRRESGSYYTPNPVVDAMVAMTDQLVRTRLRRPQGLASSDVKVVDPAAGTGTFLFRIIERIAATVRENEGEGAVPARLEQAASRLVGFELQTGPFSVAQLRLAEELRRHGAAIDGDALRLYVANTLDDPYVEQTRLGAVYEPLARSRRSANQVKAHEDVLVVIGNPPYRERSRGKGGFVEQGNQQASIRPPLGAFMPSPSAGLGPHIKHLYNPYVYFWRWATWKVFDPGEHNPDGRDGVVAFITVAGFLNGPGFAKMREYLRRSADAVWVIDLSPEGHQPDVPTRVFTGVQQPVCITIALRDGSTGSDQPAPVQFRSLAPGTRETKFAELGQIDVGDSTAWQRCGDGWDAPFLPASAPEWLSYPALADVVPWSGSGTMPGRIWVVSPDSDTLRARWQRLIDAPVRQKPELLDEHPRDRTIHTVLRDNLPGYPTQPRSLADETASCPPPQRIGYRSFDRQWIVPDKRVINQPNPSLWWARSDRQVYLTALQGHSPTNGPAVTFTALVPDLHHYKGSFGGRAFPLWRDPDGSSANLAPGLLAHLEHTYGTAVTALDLFAYLAAVLSHPGYVARFVEDLQVPGLRVPLTADATLFAEAVHLGQRVLWLHTYGERYSDVPNRPAGPPRAPDSRRPLVRVAIPSSPDAMPDALTYDPASQRLHIGAGIVSPVEEAVWRYEVSGMRVLAKWFSYRKRDPEGRRSSPLDAIHPPAWTAQYTTELLELLNVLTLVVDLEPEQADLLERVLQGPQITVETLTTAGVLPPTPAARAKPAVPNVGQDTLLDGR